MHLEFAAVWMPTQWAKAAHSQLITRRGLRGDGGGCEIAPEHDSSAAVSVFSSGG